MLDVYSHKVLNQFMKLGVVCYCQVAFINYRLKGD